MATKSADLSSVIILDDLIIRWVVFCSSGETRSCKNECRRLNGYARYVRVILQMGTMGKSPCTVWTIYTIHEACNHV